ncbi:Ig-like domain-containing protein [Meridianimarinicoccus roseus]|nr:Ig-like domain-containing protein [Meridianimarinicoccus roseus]
MTDTSSSLAPAPQTTVTVTSTAELAQAVSDLNASGGGTILLDAAGGPYDIMLSRVGSAEAPLTIAALDADAPPLVHAVDIDRCSHVTITGMHIEDMETTRGKDVQITRSTHIDFTGNTMQGRADGFLAEDNGATCGNSAIFVRYGSDVSITDNDIRGYFHGVGVLDTADFTLSGNEITQIQGDGFRGGGIDGAVLSYNHMHDFYGAVQTITHTDMIQLWGSGTSQPNRDIVISNNILDAGDGAATQTIFIRNEEIGKDTPAGDYFQNITITDNVVHNGARHGIAVSNTEGLVISDNTVLWNETVMAKTTTTSPGSNDQPWINITDAPGVTVEGNIAGNISINDSGDIDQTALRAQNTFLSYTDSSSVNYAYDHFVNLGGGSDTDLRDIMLRPDSPLFGTMGAEGSSKIDLDADVTPIISSQPVAGTTLMVDLTAFALAQDGSQVDMSTAQIAWSFDDGTIRLGETARHTFETPGTHTVRIDMIDADGRSATLVRTVLIDNPVLVDLDFGTAITDVSGRDTAGALQDMNGGALVQTADGGYALHITEGNNYSFDRSGSHLFNLDRFKIDMALQLDSTAETGDIFTQHTVMKMSVLSDGALRFHMNTDAGGFAVVSDRGLMRDTDLHDISVSYDSQAQELVLRVDGTIVGTAFATGQTPPPTSWGLSIGGGWGAKINGLLHDFRISQPDSPLMTSAAAAGTDGAVDMADDALLAGDAFANLLVGGDGDDTFLDTDGNDTMLGGVGNDTVHYGGAFESYVVDVGAGTIRHADGETDTIVSVETLRFADGTFETDTGTFAANKAPEAADDILRTPADTLLRIDAQTLLANDVDDSPASLKVVDVTSGANGSIALDTESGEYVYTPRPGFNGIDTVSYTVQDEFGATSQADIRLLVGTAPADDILQSAFSDADAEQYRIDTSDPAGFRVGGSGVSFGEDGIDMDGSGSLSLGRLKDFEKSSALALSIDFSLNDLGDDPVRLVWNHTNVGLELRGNDLFVSVGETLRHTVQDAGVQTTERQNIKLWIDEDADSVALVVNGNLVEDPGLQGVDLKWVGGGEWGWNLGGAWGRTLDGTIHDFALMELDWDDAQSAYGFESPEYGVIEDTAADFLDADIPMALEA